MTWNELEKGSIFCLRSGNGVIYECAEKYNTCAKVYILTDDLQRKPGRFNTYVEGVVSDTNFDNNNAFEYETII